MNVLSQLWPRLENVHASLPDPGGRRPVLVSGCFGALFINPQDVLAYAYLAIPLFLARLFLPGILFITLPVAVIVGVLGVSWVLGGGLTEAITATVVLAPVSFFFAVARQHHVAFEQDRRDTLAASERELRTILDNMQDTYFRTDWEGRIVRASEAGAQLPGSAPTGLRGRPRGGVF